MSCTRAETCSMTWPFFANTNTKWFFLSNVAAYTSPGSPAVNAIPTVSRRRISWFVTAECRCLLSICQGQSRESEQGVVVSPRAVLGHWCPSPWWLEKRKSTHAPCESTLKLSFSYSKCFDHRHPKFQSVRLLSSWMTSTSVRLIHHQ